MLAIHEALEKLALESAQKAEIVKLRYFTGLELGASRDRRGAGHFPLFGESFMGLCPVVAPPGTEKDLLKWLTSRRRKRRTED